MSSDLPLVSIIIPHWNGIKVLEECLYSLQKSTYPLFEIIVVDNASDDGSQTWVRANFPHVKLVENKHNEGYAGGCNRGIRYANGEYILFLNNDTVQDPEWIEPLVALLENNPEIAAVQPKLLNYYDHTRFDYAGAAGGHVDILGFPFARGRIFLTQEIDQGQYENTEQIFWSTGTAFLVRKTEFLKAGGFDEVFFAHMEEIDLCWRLQLMGHQIWVEPRSVVYHKNAVSLPMNSTHKYYLNHRNSLLMLLSNYTTPLTLYLFPLRYVLEWVAFFYAFSRWDGRHMIGIVKAQIWLLFHPRVILRKRRLVKSLRNVKDRILMSNMYRGSAVLAHYLGRKTTYSDLISRPRR